MSREEGVSAGTGELQSETESEEDSVRVPISVAYFVGEDSRHYITLPAQSVTLTTASACLTFECVGFNSEAVSPEILLNIAQELIRASLARLRAGTVQVNGQDGGH